MRLELRIEHNPRYKEIFDLSDNLLSEMVEVTRALEPIKIPKLWPWKAGAQLKAARRKIFDMTPRYNKWYGKATDFARNPEMTVGGTSELEQAVNFLHYLNVLVNRINELEAKFNGNERDYRELASISREAKTFFWAIVFFSSSTIIAVTLALVSIALALVSILAK